MRRIPVLALALLLPAAGAGLGEAPRLAFLIAEDEYQAARTLPAFAREHLASEYRVSFLEPPRGARDDIGGMEALAEADLILLYVRRRSLPEAKMRLFREALEAGTPLLALRTSSHAWDTRGRPGRGVEWKEFDAQVLGGNYQGHHGKGPLTLVEVVAGMGAHPVLEGVGELEGRGSLYRASPLSPSAQVLLSGSIAGAPPEPVLWFHRYGEAPVIYTSLGDPRDFEQPGFSRLLRNAVSWLLEQARD